MKKQSFLARYLPITLSVFISGFFAVSAQAVPITYQFMGSQVAGDVEGVEFNDADMLISIDGDTTSVTTDAFGALISGLTGSITLTGGLESINYSGTFDDLLYVFTDSSVDLVGFGAGVPPAGDLLDLYIPGVGSYDLTTAIGPLAASSIYNYIDVLTSFGGLVVDAVNIASFQALGGVILPPPPQPAPVPSRAPHGRKP